MREPTPEEEYIARNTSFWGPPPTFEQLSNWVPLRRILKADYESCWKFWEILVKENHWRQIPEWDDYIRTLTFLLGQADREFFDPEATPVEFDSNGLILPESRKELILRITLRLGLPEADRKRPLFWEFLEIVELSRRLSSNNPIPFGVQVILQADKVEGVPCVGTNQLIITRTVGQQLHFRLFNKEGHVAHDCFETDFAPVKHQDLAKIKRLVEDLILRRRPGPEATMLGFISRLSHRSVTERMSEEIYRTFVLMTDFKDVETPPAPESQVLLAACLDRWGVIIAKEMMGRLCGPESEKALHEVLLSYQAAAKWSKELYCGNIIPSGSKYDKLVAGICIARVKTGRLPTKAGIRKFLVKKLKLTDLDAVDEKALTRSIKKLGLAHWV